ncbi:M-phase inducer phosphatase-like [Homarus americanus]|uniref:M-phase inducer phosphatase-like n=1 Tax=Homarus americanus TaxID=6706 RepID=UPI001C43A58D|nr:M-phase inducer phosphatase-like [Homarus americanus]XP_042219712.1 M-phase inducer phosphatase-like [Homarus americanus]
MSSRDVLYRSVLRGGQSECPQMSSDLSPMSNLALTLHGASLAQTPKRKLSLSSTLSDTPQSCHDASSLLCSSLLQDSHSPDSTSSCEEPPVSPSHRLTSRDKENFPSPYYSPSRSAVILPRSRASPLQDVQNTVNRNLSFSPLKKNLQLVSPSKRVFTSPPKPSPPDDFDSNSHDSGYSESGKKMEGDCFSVPVSCAPRKLNLDLSPPKPRMISPVKSVSTVVSSITPVPTIFSAVTSTPASSSSGAEGRRPFRKFSSLSKGDEEDTMLMDLMNEMTTQEEQQPLGFSNLLLAPIQPPSANTSSRSILDGRPSIRRCLSMVDTTPTSSRVESIFKPPSLENSRPSTVSFKRPQPPTDLSNFSDCKRRKPDESCDQLSPLTSNASTTTGEKIRTPLTHRQVSAPEPSTSQAVKPKLQRCLSESHVSIMKALNKSSGHDGDLIGDFSKPVLLPVVEGGKHPDLKAISVETLAEVVRGKFNSKVASCRIIDCRYPYEFEGGHITGAEMWHHPKMVEENLNAQKGAPVIVNEEAPRQILIFHCEFSAERGPKAQRLLREMDRTANKEHYPALHFPEMYLLEGGYKAFFEKYPELCTPKDYVKMLDSNHAEDLKHFRGKSKSWAAENKQSKSRTTLPRPGLKRLGL